MKVYSFRDCDACYSNTNSSTDYCVTHVKKQGTHGVREVN